MKEEIAFDFDEILDEFRSGKKLRECKSNCVNPKNIFI